MALYRDEHSLLLRIRPLQAGTYFVSVCVQIEPHSPLAPPAPAANSTSTSRGAGGGAGGHKTDADALNYRVCKLRVEAARVQSGRAAFALESGESEELGATRHARAAGLHFEPLCPYVHSRDGSRCVTFSCESSDDDELMTETD